jgi:hypothetical protein
LQHGNEKNISTKQEKKGENLWFLEQK